MAPIPQAQHKTPCEEHGDKIERINERLDRGDVVLELVKEIKLAVCGDERLGIKGLISLHARIDSLERQRTWLLGAAAVITAAFPFVWAYAVK